MGAPPRFYFSADTDNMHSQFPYDFTVYCSKNNTSIAPRLHPLADDMTYIFNLADADGIRTQGVLCHIDTCSILEDVTMEDISTAANGMPPTEPVKPAPKNIPFLSLRPVYMSLTLIVGVLIGASGLFAYQAYFSQTHISTFDECIKANGSQQLLIYPGICTTRSGKRFTQPIDTIQTPPTMSDETITDPSVIRPQELATGWYWGSEDQKKSNTPEDWIFTPAGRNSCWHKPNITCATHATDYSCPPTEWVDCMPGPDEAGIKLECTQEFLTWAKENCLNFEGAAL